MKDTRFSAGIIGIGSCSPEKIVTNEDLAKIVDTSEAWIRTRTGIRERRITDDKTATSDLAFMASHRALKDAGISGKDIDLIIVATCTPDYIVFPSTACLLQDKIGASKAAAFDLSAACSGFVYALSVGHLFVTSGFSKNVLVVGADSLSKYINWQDRNTCVLFGDGAGAVVLATVPNDEGILSTYLGADGSSADCLKVSAGGSKFPMTPEILEKKLQYIQMSGREVFKFAVRIVEKSTLKVLKISHLTLQDINFFIFHQANLRIIEHVAKSLGIPEEKIYNNVERYGNTSAASIPIALDELVKLGRLKKGDNLVLCGFGAGLTWGAGVVRWSK